MWLILEECGVICAIFTYFIVIFVYWGFIRVGIWEEIQEGSLWAIINFIIFQYHCVLIFMSHFKCMTTEPGVLPKDTEVLDFYKLPEGFKKMLRQIGR